MVVLHGFEVQPSVMHACYGLECIHASRHVLAGFITNVSRHDRLEARQDHHRGEVIDTGIQSMKFRFCGQKLSMLDLCLPPLYLSSGQSPGALRFWALEDSAPV